MDNIQQVYCVNLPECTNRLKNFDDNMREHNIHYTLWKATKGKEISNEDIKQYTSFICRKFTCTHGSIGCYLSHLKLWKHIQAHFQNENQFFLIFEDDSFIDESFLTNIQDIFDDLKSWEFSSRNPYPEYINLASSFSPGKKKVTEHLSRSFIVNGTSAYLVSRKGIDTLIKNLDKRVHYHVDFTLTAHNIASDSLAYYTTNNYVVNNDNFNSSISNTYPKLAPLILNYLLSVFRVNNHTHILYDSALVTFARTISCNIFVVLYVVLIALFVFYKKYGWLVLLVIAEIVADIISFNKVATGC